MMGALPQSSARPFNRKLGFVYAKYFANHRHNAALPRSYFLDQLCQADTRENPKPVGRNRVGDQTTRTSKKERYAMNENRVVPFRQEDEIDDPLTEILRTGAHRLITRAVEIEFDTFLASNADLALPDGRQRVVRHGHDPVRTVQTGIGPVEVQKPKARDRGAPEAGERIRFTSAILPKWARRTKSLDALLPALYLRGISAGDFQEVLTALLGKDAPNLSPAVIARLKGEWEDEYQRWQKRDLSARRYVYVW